MLCEDAPCGEVPCVTAPDSHAGWTHADRVGTRAEVAQLGPDQPRCLHASNPARISASMMPLRRRRQFAQHSIMIGEQGLVIAANIRWYCRARHPNLL